ncbi:aminopeptidase II [Scopulibacillus darangshiensis]|uniref:Aminopeptidase II n=1 Tax=Scopulibacillus darangshiensis TaxID=442528 RepID=A0A4V2SN66_9BACL|nr:aminopeptidase [Scopulibacillus darangshiensis]TCP29996.1 aminopeptidase II [Scopulibacillus darangshiensis]
MAACQEKIDQYAKLTVKMGLNIQKGQILAINSPLESAEFTRAVVREAYRLGAKRVHVDWSDSPTQRLQFEEQPEESLKEVPKWRVEMYDELIENKGALLHITGADPNAFAGVDPKRIQMVQQASGQSLKDFKIAQLKGDIHWCIVGVPTVAWAKLVFPDKAPDQALDDLWEAIFKTVRLDHADPIAAWDQHSKDLHDKMNYLNDQHFKALHYKGPGTDLSIELHPDHLWVGAGHKSTQEHVFIPNMPTEEVFTAPLKTGVNGTVKNTKPLSVNGNLIENFSFTFKDGKVVNFSAEKGYEALEGLLDTDESARYLGEVALVPHQSPISQSGIIFMNTLYDENASCHIALGTSFSMNVKNGSNMSEEELIDSGANQSFIHTDFMIGSGELDIDAETQDGKRIPLFRNGNWAI